MIKRITEAIFGFVNILFIGYVGLEIYILVQWWVSDVTALTAGNNYWLKIAVMRFSIFSGIAVILSFTVYLLNYLIWKFVFKKAPSSLPFYFAMALLINGILIAAISSVQFFIEKPFWD